MSSTIARTVVTNNGIIYNHCRVAASDQCEIMQSDIILVIDCSMSMDNRAEGKGNAENSVFSLLDLVVQACKVIVKSTDKRVAIINYSDDANVVSNFTNDKNALMNKLDNIRSIGSTNIWSGLKMALDMTLDSGYCDILLFTDGEVNKGPTSYHENVAGYVRKNHIYNASLFTFGFGTGIGRAPLVRSSEACRGRFTYISSPDMVGTKFISFAAGLASRVDNIVIDLPSGCTCPGYEVIDDQINIGWLLEGSTRDFVIVGEMPDADNNWKLMPSQPAPFVATAVEA